MELPPKQARVDAVDAMADSAVVVRKRRRAVHGGKQMKSATNKSVKHAIKWLADQSPRSSLAAIGEYLKVAPAGVIKGIVNAALNLERNPVIKLSKGRKRYFARHRKQIAYLTDRSVGFRDKRRALQTGGFIPLAILAPILSTVVGALATKFLSNN